MDYSNVFEIDKLTLGDCESLYKSGYAVVLEDGKIKCIKKRKGRIK